MPERQFHGVRSRIHRIGLARPITARLSLAHRDGRGMCAHHPSGPVSTPGHRSAHARPITHPDIAHPPKPQPSRRSPSPTRTPPTHGNAASARAAHHPPGRRSPASTPPSWRNPSPARSPPTHRNPAKAAEPITHPKAAHAPKPRQGRAAASGRGFHSRRRQSPTRTPLTHRKPSQALATHQRPGHRPPRRGEGCSATIQVRSGGGAVGAPGGPAYAVAREAFHDNPCWQTGLSSDCRLWI